MATWWRTWPALAALAACGARPGVAPPPGPSATLSDEEVARLERCATTFERIPATHAHALYVLAASCAPGCEQLVGPEAASPPAPAELAACTGAPEATSWDVAQALGRALARLRARAGAHGELLARLERSAGVPHVLPPALDDLPAPLRAALPRLERPPSGHPIAAVYLTLGPTRVAVTPVPRLVFSPAGVPSRVDDDSRAGSDVAFAQLGEELAAEIAAVRARYTARRRPGDDEVPELIAEPIVIAAGEVPARRVRDVVRAAGGPARLAIGHDHVLGATAVVVGFDPAGRPVELRFRSDRVELAGPRAPVRELADRDGAVDWEAVAGALAALGPELRNDEAGLAVVVTGRTTVADLVRLTAAMTAADLTGALWLREDLADVPTLAVEGIHTLPPTAVHAGSLAAPIVERALQRTTPALRACYAETLAAGAPRPRLVTAGFVVGRDGRVRDVTATGGEGGLAACVARALGPLHLPRPSRGSVQVRVTLRFRPD